MDEKDFERSLKGFKKVLEQRDSCLELTDVENELENVTKDFEKAKDKHHPSVAEPYSIVAHSTEEQFQRQLAELNDRLGGLKLKYDNKVGRQTLEKSLNDFRQAHEQNAQCIKELRPIEESFKQAAEGFDKIQVKDGAAFHKTLQDLDGRLSGLKRKWGKHVTEETLEKSLKDFEKDHQRNYKCQEELKAIRIALTKAKFDHKNRLLALPVGTSDFEFDKTLRDLDEKLSDLERQWEALVLKGSVGIGDSIQQSEYWALERKLQIYSQMFDMWQKLREQRADYNKEFFSKLFISTLVAILLPLLASTGITALTPLVLILLIGVLAGAAGICVLWAIKLWALWKTEHAQRHTLKMMEKSLNLPFCTTDVLNENAIELTSTSRLIYLDLDYYGPAVIMAIIFFVLLLTVIWFWSSPWTAAVICILVLLAVHFRQVVASQLLSLVSRI
jgi:exonuclease VII small subunit